MGNDSRRLRDCLGRFATGVTVVTCEVDGEPHGATVNSFTAVSLDPALVLVSLDRRAKACRYLRGRPFAVNVLRASQDELALHFAGAHGRPTVPVQWERPAGGAAPRLRGSLAHLVCRPWRSYDGGDHVLFLGQVEEHAFHPGDPLLFYRGDFRQLGPMEEPAPWLGSADCPDLRWLPELSDSTTRSTT
ncbi:flavin reductase family protein [Streptomyces sp. 8N616]|uniref:flavin reductase family protein n=1 Tax=Streptomyces sp. 8N616 TaxID=3457414 RepID=UPI003FD28ECE